MHLATCHPRHEYAEYPQSEVGGDGEVVEIARGEVLWRDQPRASACDELKLGSKLF